MAHPAEIAIDGVLRGFPCYSIDDYLSAKDNHISGAKPRKLLSREETCQRLGNISQMTLHRLTQRKEISPVRIGSRVFFDIHEIDSFIDKKAAPQ
jgi:hypothetical protein